MSLSWKLCTSFSTITEIETLIPFTEERIVTFFFIYMDLFYIKFSLLKPFFFFLCNLRFFPLRFVFSPLFSFPPSFFLSFFILGSFFFFFLQFFVICSYFFYFSSDFVFITFQTWRKYFFLIYFFRYLVLLSLDILSFGISSLTSYHELFAFDPVFILVFRQCSPISFFI